VTIGNEDLYRQGDSHCDCHQGFGWWAARRHYQLHRGWSAEGIASRDFGGANW
jgi:hypothetical protein